MKKIVITILAGLLPAFFMLGSSIAQEAKVCDPVTQESVLTKGIQESPELLMVELEGEELLSFWQNVREAGMMVGTISIDKVYVFYSENHPEWVYVYFLKEGCIIDIKFTFKELIERFLK